MAIRKKTSTESETVRADEFAAAAQKLAHTRRTATPELAPTAEQKKVAPKSSAATHKAPARKSVMPMPAAEAVGPNVAEWSSVDISLHHEEISKEAYHHWLRNGCQQGSQHDDWLAAIEIVRERFVK